MAPKELSNRELNDQTIAKAIKKLKKAKKTEEVASLILFLKDDSDTSKDPITCFEITGQYDPVVIKACDIINKRWRSRLSKKNKNSKPDKDLSLFKEKAVFQRRMDLLIKRGMFDKNGQFNNMHGDKGHMVALIKILVDDQITKQDVNYKSLYKYYRDFHGVPRLSDIDRRQPEKEANMRRIFA